MKRKILLLTVFLLIMFSGCGGPAAANPDSLFHFPGLSWGMSPEEVKAALPIQDGEIEESPFSSAADYNSYTILWAPDQQVYFGEAAYHIFFRFQDWGKTGRYQLHRIELYYPEDCPMETVRRELSASYGEELTADRLAEQPTLGALEMQPPAPDSAHEADWAGQSLAEVLTQQEQDDDWVFLSTQNPELTREDFDAFLSQESPVQIRWYDNAYDTVTPEVPEGYTQNLASFQANYISAQQMGT